MDSNDGLVFCSEEYGILNSIQIPQRICAWCDKRMNDKDEPEGAEIPKQLQVGNNVTHGIFKHCEEKIKSELG